ncbi:carbohydrate sulfotransferase 10 [Lingula anatina]|uniref:Carbohydrate sulfotransferase n=1 Tax=Lingula anatina TaxID=7574 RepID=A0A1S3HS73_LINAN|nr:carbohydrate sulfotransferase 10 [Lingula anatina]XP_013388883.1 carbohydrate sulfotransferase 10 [Lingula anatina]XP_013388884.1 carbohydrate sulfotransferase 10 [Lingula anatina]XP_013388885.1 carbohydrate sulfotransferase 10 [Lingula anatina]|eukprot:XP_013388882.1 carbohydrate sulfotransferase 10 [Lingula anatina]
MKAARILVGLTICGAILYWWTIIFTAKHGNSLNHTSSPYIPHAERDTIGQRIWENFNWQNVSGEWVSIINKRNHMMQDRCGSLKKAPSGRLERRRWILVDDRNKFILCPLFKAASRNWRLVYQVISGHLNISGEQDIFNRRPDGFAYTRLDSYDDINIKKRLATYLKVLVVRHPMERIISAYKDQVLGLLGPQIKLYLNKHYPKQIEHKIGFADFLRFIVDKKATNSHWALVQDFCLPCHVMYDVIVHHEDLDTDAMNVIRLLGVEDIVPQFPSSHFTSNNPNQSLIYTYYNSIDRKLVEKVWKIYKEDASFFGYTLEL